MTTRKVINPEGRIQIVVRMPMYSNVQMIRDVAESVSEDGKRIGAALLKENLHLQSDKFTKSGLPIPLLSAGMQQELLENKWNSKELEDVIKSGMKGTAVNFVIASILNMIVGTLHGFCYNEEEDESRNLYAVRTIILQIFFRCFWKKSSE